MSQLEKDIKDISRRMITEKGQNYKDTSKYLNSIMKSAKQEDLIACLPKLNLHELKRVIAAGVPGHAMYAANEILNIRKDEIRAFEEKQIESLSVDQETPNIKKDDKIDVS